MCIRDSSQGLRGLEDCGLEFVNSRVRGFGPPLSQCSSADSESAREMVQIAPFQSFWDPLSPFPALAQFKLPTPEAPLRYPDGGLPIEASRTTHRHWADCGLHFGHPAM
eukprot:7310759-Alexandrium_andersonii.AAC.1